ncbi:MAG TPA: phage major capsid protein [Intrasporangium sp.]|jgi:Predicted phage phi-C31 gp36 major capsid-like protein|uniref:phage major capsid protein n=1 Tax=Intrasporangium sp. TaxID=1925024 RepID=UPI002F948D9D
MNARLTGARGMTVDELLAFHRGHFGDARMEADDKGPAVLNHAQTVNKIGEVKEELERFAELDKLTKDDEAHFAKLRDTFFQLDEHRKQLERAADLEKIREAAKGVKTTRIVPGSARGSGMDRDPMADPRDTGEQRDGDPWDLRNIQTFGRSPGEVSDELRSRAYDAIERMPGATDSVREAATDILERFDDKESTLAKLCLATSSPQYMRAWAKMARGLQHELEPSEARALAEARAMSLTDANGGYLVPFQLDPTVIITSNGSLNQIRQAARQVVATGDVWNGVSSAAVSWSWDAESSEVSDDSTTFAQPNVPVYTARGFVPITIEALMDEQNVTSEVAKLLAEGKDDLESVAFATGSGSGQPTGIVTALAGTSSEINAAADDTFALADVYTLEGALPAKHRGRASWLANNSIYNRIRQFDTAGGAGLWARVGEGRPNELLGRPALEAESMDGTVTTTGATSNFILVFGNFQNYVIADRIGMTVEFIPHLFHVTNNRPSGQRGWFAYYRTGADSVNDGAFRMLDVASVA